MCSKLWLVVNVIKYTAASSRLEMILFVKCTGVYKIISLIFGKHVLRI